MSFRERVGDLDRRAVAVSVELVATIGTADRARPTPCAGWNVERLVVHMTAQHRGFAAAAAGHGADPAVWEARGNVADLVAAYRLAAAAVGRAFGEPGVLQRSFALPEISTTVEFPGHIAIGFHLIDYVVHSWDVARSLGLPVRFDADVLDAALFIAERVPDDAARRLPGAAFAPALPAPANAAAIDRIVSLLGRSPSWPG
jgi:uncharacterized protein (TIGR03086 family)